MDLCLVLTLWKGQHPHHTATNGVASKLYKVKVGDLFMYGEELRPGANRVFDFTLVSGKPPEQVGITYYLRIVLKTAAIFSIK